MEKAKLDAVELEYEVTGSGEPVLFISTGPIADSFLPFASANALRQRYRSIQYHQRGQAGSTRSHSPVDITTHAADAAALLDHLGVRRAHVAGHSTGGIIALQLAADRPEVVHTLTLLEPMLLNVPSAGEFFEKAGPALAAYGSGDREEAMEIFLSVVSGLDRESCRTVIEMHVPGGIEQAVKDADTCFGGYLPALQAWEFGSEEAASIVHPVLSVLGTKTDRLFDEGCDLLRSWFPRMENQMIEGVGHLLHMQCPDPVVQAVTRFLSRHAINSC